MPISAKKSSDQTNLWPGAAMLAITFVLLVSTGIVIVFGVIQQLRYLAWEKSLRETQASLAAEKELIQLTRSLIKLSEEFTQSQSQTSYQDLEHTVSARYTSQQEALPKDPELVTQTLLPPDVINNLPTPLKQYSESPINLSVRIQALTTQIGEFNYYDIASDQGVFILISKNSYEISTQQPIQGYLVSTSYIIEE